MRIAIGAVLGVQGGPARYAGELVRALSELPGDHELTVICDRAALVEDLGPRVVEVLEVPIRAVWEQGLWDQKLRHLLTRRHYDVYHGTKGILPIFPRVPTVVTVHDLAVFHQPATFSWLQRFHQRVLVPWSVRRARKIITVSHHAQQDLCRTLHVRTEKIAVVPLAASATFHHEGDRRDAELLSEFGVSEPYVFYAGTIQPRKNVELLVSAYTQLGLPNLGLVLAGRCRPGYRPRFVAEPPHGVRYVGEVSDHALAALYRHALAFCSPSHYEGFGLSFLEAMASGCPVIAPHHSSIPEVVGDAALFLRDITVEELRAALRTVATDDALRARLRAAGLRRARQFSWVETAKATLQVYREVVDG